MPESTAIVQLTSAELAEGTIKPITIPGEGGTEQTVQIRIPPGIADGTLLRIPALDGDHHVRVTLAATLPPTAPPPPGFATPPTATPRPGSPPLHPPRTSARPLAPAARSCCSPASRQPSS